MEISSSHNFGACTNVSCWESLSCKIFLYSYSSGLKLNFDKGISIHCFRRRPQQISLHSLHCDVECFDCVTDENHKWSCQLMFRGLLVILHGYFTLYLIKLCHLRLAILWSMQYFYKFPSFRMFSLNSIDKTNLAVPIQVAYILKYYSVFNYWWHLENKLMDFMIW